MVGGLHACTARAAAADATMKKLLMVELPCQWQRCCLAQHPCVCGTGHTGHASRACYRPNCAIQILLCHNPCSWCHDDHTAACGVAWPSELLQVSSNTGQPATTRGAGPAQAAQNLHLQAITVVAAQQRGQQRGGDGCVISNGHSMARVLARRAHAALCISSAACVPLMITPACTTLHSPEGITQNYQGGPLRPLRPCRGGSGQQQQQEEECGDGGTHHGDGRLLAELARRAQEEVLVRGHVPNFVRTSHCAILRLGTCWLRHGCQGMHAHPILHTNSCIAAHA